MGNRSSSPDSPISITYDTPERSNVSEDFDFLVVACDPRNLNVTDRTRFENKINDVLHSHTFHTSLFAVERPNREETVPVGLEPNGPPQTNYAVRFDPITLERMDGSVYGFRDEVMARDDSFQPSANSNTWAVTYQIEDRALIGRDWKETEMALNKIRDHDLRSSGWVDWNPKEVSSEITVDYFAHFKSDQLDRKMPWELVDKQGENRTLYVASFTCFESVLHCYLYQNMLMRQSHVKKRFPSEKNSRIAVIGAGPAGLLFASQQLKAKGYNNYKIFEASHRYGGKTVTEYRKAPAEPSREVPCELGTCYLSSAYFPLYELFSRYVAGDVLALDRGSNAFRSIIDPKLAQNEQERMDGIEYGAWSTYVKNGISTAAEGSEAIVRASVLYTLYHVCAMGMTPEDPMPSKPPSKLRSIKNVFRVLRWIGVDDRAQDVIRLGIGNIFGAIVNGDNAFKPDNDPVGVEEARIFSDMCEKADVDIELGEILRMFTIDPLKVTFEEFLDQLGMAALKPTLVYAYQVQGYGTLTRIPAYYG